MHPEPKTGDPAKVNTTMIRVHMTRQEGKEYRRLIRAHLQEAQPSRSSAAITFLRSLGAAARPKEPILHEQLRRAGTDDTVVISCTPDEHDAVLRVCRDVQVVPFQITRHRDDHQHWLEHGGILAITASAATPDHSLAQARKAIFFGRPPSRALFEATKLLLNPSGRRRHLDEVHLVTEATTDAAAADALTRGYRTE